MPTTRSALPLALHPFLPRLLALAGLGSFERAGLDFAGLMGGAIITETVFNYNGLGKLAIDANRTNDLPTTVGLVLLLATFVIVANIIVDLLYAVIDPRVRLG